MQSDASWKELNLGDVIELKRGYDLPKGKRSVGVIPIVSSSGISDFHSEAMVKGPGVVTGRYGTIGEVFYIDGDFWPLNTTLYVCDFKGSDPRFISYFLRTLDFQAYSDKGAVPGVNRNHLHTAKVRIPALPVQKAIARILDALDSKIDLNHRINQTLEAMAQAIFKSWFIDFDPVKARIAAIEQGQDPLRAAMRAISGKTDAELDQMPREHHDQLAATAALFSDAMEESELWEIPKGWGIKSVSNIARFATGKIEVSSLTVENYISTENMLENRGGISHASSLPAVATVPTFESGNVLVSNIRPYFKKIWLARFDGGRSNDVLCFEAKEDGCQEFLYNLLYQDIFFEFMMRTSKGAKMPRGDKEAIAGWKFPCAPLELRKAFSKKGAHILLVH
ncbi:restriction endonuclease subunit S [Pseudomonas aeruginosa]|uniref:restriction endonuclease subunit S n=1 Tax=Pseudomonas aeruginosa TaxID=287 RepID=UPI0022EC0A3F|nr:restriction endonuclease subunit S [Pseudomonas aeruginosa]